MSDFRVLFVCTGNLCRSPIAATLFRDRVRELGVPGVTVSSAGTHAYPDHAIDSVAAAALREVGHPADEHRTTRLQPHHVDSAHLVLTASIEHRRHLLSESPGAIRRTFTLREFARLGAGLEPADDEDLRARVAAVAARRGLVEPGPDDLADPFGAAYPVMQQCVREVDVLVTAIVDVLGVVESVVGKPEPVPALLAG